MSGGGYQQIHLERFSRAARALIVAAQKLADARRDKRVETAHLLVAALADAAVASAMRSAGADVELLRATSAAALERLDKSRGESAYLSSAMLALLSQLEGRRQQGEAIAVSRLMTALAASADPIAELFPRAGLARGTAIVVADSSAASPPTELLKLHRYEPAARQLVVAAQALADRRGHATVEPIHLLAVVVASAPDAAEELAIDPESALARIAKSAGGEPAYLTPSMVALLARAERDAGGAFVTSSDLTRALREALTPAPEPKVLALLSPPPPADATKRRRAPAPLVEALVAMLLTDERARILGRAAGSATIAFDCGEGRNVRVALAPARIALDAVLEEESVYDEEHGEWIEDEDVNDAVNEVAFEVVRRLQRATGWHVEADYADLDPEGECPACGIEIFEWEASCAACGEDLEAPDDEEDAADEADEDDDGPSHRRLASVSPPDSGDASRWHRARPTPAIAELVALLLLLPRARVDHRNDASAVVSIDIASANTLRVSVHRNAIVLDELLAADEDRDEPTSEAVDSVALALLSSVQQATHWYVRSDYYEGFEPCGACPGCHVEAFRWQELCAACATPIPAAWRPKSELVAESVLEQLLAEGLLELAEPRAEVEAVVAEVLRTRAGTPAQLLDALADAEEVDEIFADELALERILARATAAANEQLRLR